MIRWLTYGYLLVGFIAAVIWIHFLYYHDDIDIDDICVLYIAIMLSWPVVTLAELLRRLLQKIWRNKK